MTESNISPTTFLNSSLLWNRKTEVGIHDNSDTKVLSFNKFDPEAEINNTINTTNNNSNSNINISKGSDDNESIKSKDSLTSDGISKGKDDKEKKVKKKRDKEKAPVFGDLDKVELDEELMVPKFVVECIKIIEQRDNIETNGIYRASGNKNSIELVKTKLSGKKKPNYEILAVQDIHTVTGLLKLFFRETSDIIPEEVLQVIPKNLGLDENIDIIKSAIDKLPEIQRATLAYLIKHLKKVEENCKENLMTSSNLSIIWGACLFTKSVNSIMSLMETDIMNRNVLIKIFIDKFDQIFESEISKL